MTWNKKVIAQIQDPEEHVKISGEGPEFDDGESETNMP